MTPIRPVASSNNLNWETRMTSNTKGWEVEYITETSYSVRSYQTAREAHYAADKWLAEQHPIVDPKVWVRRAR